LGPFDKRLFNHDKIVTEFTKAGINSEQDINIRRIGDKKLLTPFFQSYQVPPNSDYFPYIDLYAAQARFTNQKADIVTALGLAPLPLLEMLDTPARWIGKDVSASSDFTRASTVANAHILRAILLDHNVEVSKKFPFKEHALVTLLSLSSQSCNTNAKADL